MAEKRRSGEMGQPELPLGFGGEGELEPSPGMPPPPETEPPLASEPENQEPHDDAPAREPTVFEFDEPAPDSAPRELSTADGISAEAKALADEGASLGALGQFEEAEERLRRALRLDPDHGGARTELGILFFRRGLYLPAESELRAVCAADGANGRAHFYRGEVLNRLGRFDEALTVLEQASRLEPERARTYYLLGILYDRKHLGSEANAMYRRARELT